MHMLETELLLRANDFQANPVTQFIIKFMRYPRLILVEFEHRRGIDTNDIVTIRGLILDAKTPKLNYTLEDILAHDLVDLMLDQKVLKYVVVGLILLYTEIIFHSDIKPRIIMQCGSSWKLTDLQYSRKIDDSTFNE